MEKTPSSTDGVISKSAETVEHVPHLSGEVPVVRIHAQTIIALVAVCFMQFALISATIASAALAQASTGLFGDSGKAAWLNTVILLFSVAGNPLLGQAVDLWGGKWIIVATSFAGIVGSIITSRAQNITSLIAGFCVLSMAFCCQFTLLAIVSEILPRRHRAIGQVLINVGIGLAIVSGALACGALIRDGDAERYRIFFYYLTALFTGTTFGIAFGYNPPERELQRTLTFHQKLQRLDWVGMVLISSGLTLFCVGLQYSGNSVSWGNAKILAPFIAGVSLIVGFAMYEWKLRPDGILHHDLFRHKNFALCVVIVALEGLSFFTTNQFLTLESVVIEGADAWEASLRFAVACSAGIVLLIIIGLFMTRYRMIREPVAFGFYYNSELGGSGVFRFATPPEMIAVTSAIFTAGRSVGGAIGIAVNNALFENTLSSQLPKKVAAAVVPLGFAPSSLPALITALLSRSQQAVLAMPNVTPTIIAAASNAVDSAYAASFRNTWYGAAAFAALGGVVSLFLANPSDEFTVNGYTLAKTPGSQYHVGY
ncbi:MFS general substrate transporter [Zopfia rhizophila CBS 207.26]|uniref:MFS general substrate transporter n=1 Tax=Zopfia rhizophila CBS 207.26 TaxID=1314779 RepID=A0A6A6DPH4_9PEZI|nr:MFS general substrate transporter [Zopfia rhizophila CBS 207.26]